MYCNSQRPQINLARHAMDLPLFVDMERFFEFSFWVSEELLDLEAVTQLKQKLVESEADMLPETIARRISSAV